MSLWWWGLLSGFGLFVSVSLIGGWLLVRCMDWSRVVREAERDLMKEWGCPSGEEPPEPSWDYDHG